MKSQNINIALSTVSNRLIARLEKEGFTKIPTVSGFDYTMAGKGIKILFLEERDGRTQLIFMDAVRNHTFYHSAKCEHEGHLEDAWNTAERIREKFVRFEFMDYANVPMYSAFLSFMDTIGAYNHLQSINSLIYSYTVAVNESENIELDADLLFIAQQLQFMLMDAMKAEALQDSINVYATVTENTPDAWAINDGHFKFSAIDTLYDKAA